MFGNDSVRLRWLRGSLLVACILTMLASMPLWLTSRTYPLLPIASWFPILHPPFDQVIFIASLISLIAAAWFYRPAVIAFLIFALYLALADQTRWQPWFYLYCVCLLLSLNKPPTALAACRFAIAGVYLWSGIQKCNPDYFYIAIPWLAKGGADWMPAFADRLLRYGLALAPAVEIFIALAVWHSRTRRVALGLTIALHAAALLLLGPLGHKHNWIVWPWNIVMPILLITLFPAVSMKASLAALRPWPAIVVALFVSLPALSFLGYWDSYLAFSLYTGHLTKADLFISAEVKNRLPAEIQPFIVPTPPPFNQEIQGPYVVIVELWADKILKVPPLPEPRGYLRVAEYVASFATDPNDVRLVLIPRGGKATFYRGSDLRKKAGIPLALPN